MHGNTVKVVIMVFEPCDLLCHQSSLSPNRADTEGGAAIYAHITLVRQTNFPPIKIVTINRQLFTLPWTIAVRIKTGLLRLT